MIDLLAIYICPKHGEILEDVVMKSEIVDTVNDEVYPVTYCICGSEVHPKIEMGMQCFETVDRERWLWATGFYDDPTEDAAE